MTNQLQAPLLPTDIGARVADRTALYRLYDAEGHLLYVGITRRLGIRFSEHARTHAATWWPLVEKRAVEWFDTRYAAAQAEVNAIRTENPLHNVLHTPKNRVPLGSPRDGRSNRKISEQRGLPLLRKAEEVFGDEPFTQEDLRGLVDQSPAAVAKNVRALIDRGQLVIVGTRRIKGRYAQPYNLYVVAGSPYVHAAEPIKQVVPGPARDLQRPLQPRGREALVLKQAWMAFGTSPWSTRDLAERMGSRRDTLPKYIRKLMGRGFLTCSGSRRDPDRAFGKPSTLYVITEAGLASASVSVRDIA